jgi:hypothetical protein
VSEEYTDVRDDGIGSQQKNGEGMLAGLVIAGVIASAAGLVLRIGAFAIFALMTGVLYFGLLLHQNHTLPSALGAVLLLLVVMQVCYAIGVLLPPLIFRMTGHRRRVPQAQPSADPQESSSNTRPL